MLDDEVLGDGDTIHYGRRILLRVLAAQFEGLPARAGMRRSRRGLKLGVASKDLKRDLQARTVDLEVLVLDNLAGDQTLPEDRCAVVTVSEWSRRENLVVKALTA